MTNTFYFEDGKDNLFDEHGRRVYDAMEGGSTASCPKINWNGEKSVDA